MQNKHQNLVEKPLTIGLALDKIEEIIKDGEPMTQRIDGVLVELVKSTIEATVVSMRQIKEVTSKRRHRVVGDSVVADVG